MLLLRLLLPLITVLATVPPCCQLRFWMIRQSNDEACSRLSLCCQSCLVWRAAAIIAVRAYIVVRGISEFLHDLVQFLICSEFIEPGTFILQGVEVLFHWRIVVGVSGFAHAPGHIDGFAEFYGLSVTLATTLLS